MKRLPEDCQGGCACGYVRYRLTDDPFIVHACHCRYCQRQTGTAFAQNALTDASAVTLLSGDVELTVLATPSGNGQQIARCPRCRVAVWSNYYAGGLKELMRFIRVGTLDNPDLLPPDVHIFTESKQPWVVLPDNIPSAEQFYIYEDTWSAESQAKNTVLHQQITDRSPFSVTAFT